MTFELRSEGCAGSAMQQVKGACSGQRGTAGANALRWEAWTAIQERGEGQVIVRCGRTLEATVRSLSFIFFKYVK